MGKRWLASADGSNKKYSVETDATIGADIGVNLRLDGQVLSLAQLKAIFGSVSTRVVAGSGTPSQGGAVLPPGGDLTTDMVYEGRANLYFTDERAQDAVGTILAPTANIVPTYDDATPEITFDLTLTGVAPGTYGDATHVPVITVDEWGRVTDISLATISGGGGGGTITVTSSVALAAGNIVNFWNNSGVADVRKADATVIGKEAHGFVDAAVTAGGVATVKLAGNVITALSGLTPGARYYLSATPGAVSLTALTTAGNIDQCIGVAQSATKLAFLPAEPITLETPGAAAPLIRDAGRTRELETTDVASLPGGALAEGKDIRTRSGNTGGGDVYLRNAWHTVVGYDYWHDNSGARTFGIGHGDSSGTYWTVFVGSTPVGGDGDAITVHNTGVVVIPALTSTTQAAHDNSTKVATTAYVDATGGASISEIRKIAMLRAY